MFRRQAREGEHAALPGDEREVPFDALGLESIHELPTHAVDPITHLLDLGIPSGSQFEIVQHGRDNR